MKLAGSMGELTQDEKLSAFRKATNSVEGAKDRWTERVKTASLMNSSPKLSNTNSAR
jgi:hypothetical protein